MTDNGKTPHLPSMMYPETLGGLDEINARDVKVATPLECLIKNFKTEGDWSVEFPPTLWTRIKRVPKILWRESNLYRSQKNNKKISANDFYKILIGLGIVRYVPNGIETRNSNIESIDEHDYAAHVNRVQDQGLIDKYKDQNLIDEYKDNIVILKSPGSYDPEFENSIFHTHGIKGKLIHVKNLTIVFSYTKSKPDGKKSIMLGDHFIDYLIDQNIYFEGCLFLSGHGDNYADYVAPLMWAIFKRETDFLGFKDCFLKNVSPRPAQIPRPIDDSQIAHQEVNMPGIRAVRTCIMYKNVTGIHREGLIACMPMIQKRHDIKETPKTIGFTLRNILSDRVLIEDCKFGFLKIEALHVVLRGKNKIKCIEFTEEMQKFIFNHKEIASAINKDFRIQFRDSIDVQWGPYQSISPFFSDTSKFDGLFSVWQRHKRILIALKSIAEERKDYLQSDILKREIMICDRHIIWEEKLSLNSLQDIITLEFNRWISNYGISWLRPIIWLFIINALYAVSTAFALCEEWHLLFISAFNPLSPEPSKYTNGYAIAFHAFQKAAFAILIYEAVRAGRRFTRFSSN